jgi:hypothetical protein
VGQGLLSTLLVSPWGRAAWADHPGAANSPVVFIPVWLLIAGAVLALALGVWAFLAPEPKNDPDRASRQLRPPPRPEGDE